jgi:hypothetical protein
MSALDKRLKGRQQQTTVAGHTYTHRRPTAAHMARLADGTRLELVRECVVDWDLKHLDLYPGGDPLLCPFDAALWSDWLDDNPDIWSPLADAITQQITQHRDQIETATKN